MPRRRFYFEGMDMDKKEFSAKADFSRSLRGYSTSEVDKYVKYMSEAYSELYRENADLEKALEEAQDKIFELEKVRETVEEAKRHAGEIVKTAYENADGILFSIKSNCDAILKGFRTKVEEQRTALAAARREVESFQYELFEKYKAHIELIEHLQPKAEEEPVSADVYVERVVSKLKREISAEYGVSIEDIAVPAGVKTQSAPVQVPVQSAVRTTPDPAAHVAGAEGYVEVEDGGKASERRIPTALEMLSEYEKKQAQAIDNDGIQLALDIDAGTSKPSEN